LSLDSQALLQFNDSKEDFLSNIRLIAFDC